ncbi:TetR/AcrR family transcriptional regulator [Chitinophagaceae bacterium MMS25-I14]
MTKSANYNVQEHRKETIVGIAEEVFAQYSFEGASIRLITEKLGVNSAMIGYYFGSKEALYLDIFKQRLKGILEEVDQFELLDLDPAEKLKAYLTTYINRIIANRNFHRLLCNELISVQHPLVVARISEARKRIHDFLLEIIENGIAEGYFKKTDKEIFVLNTLALIPSVFANHISPCAHPAKGSHENFTTRIVAYIMGILTPESIN